MEALIEVMEQVGNAPFDIKSYPKYIKLCEEQDSATLDASKDDNEANSGDGNDVGGPLAAEARGAMVNAMAVTAGMFTFPSLSGDLPILDLRLIYTPSTLLTDVWLPLLRHKAAILYALKNEVDVQELLGLFSAARNELPMSVYLSTRDSW